MALIETLQDNFNDNSINGSLWDTYTNSGSVTETGSHIELQVNANTSGAEADLFGVSTYDLTGSVAYVNCIQVASSGVDSLMFLQDDYGDRISWLFDGAGTAWALYEEGYSWIDSQDISLTPGANCYVRIREESGTIYWDYSTDGGQNWTNAMTKSVASMAFPITAMVPCLNVYEYSGSGATSEDTTIFDNFNIYPVTTDSVTKQLRYAVETTPSALTKGLQYNIDDGAVYSRQDGTSFPTTPATNDLANVYNETEEGYVEVDDAQYVGMGSVDGKYVFHMYRIRNPNGNTTDSFNIVWKGKASLRPTAKAVTMYLFDFVYEEWGTLSESNTLASNNTAGADEDFTLTAGFANWEHYADWQLDPGERNPYDTDKTVLLLVFQAL